AAEALCRAQSGERSDRRLAAAGARGLRALATCGDDGAMTALADRLRAALGSTPALLADAAADCCSMHLPDPARDLVGRHAVALLGHALRAGLATAVLDEARFAPLRVRPDFAALR
ncbi:MAG: hypothetical protein KDE27_12075, partial [Planctomycetes bacterium]|nr:hypothetical protein [Planctomycetota bacterium]